MVFKGLRVQQQSCPPCNKPGAVSSYMLKWLSMTPKKTHRPLALASTMISNNAVQAQTTVEMPPIWRKEFVKSVQSMAELTEQDASFSAMDSEGEPVGPLH